MMTGADLTRHMHHMNLRTWLEQQAAELGTDVQRAAYSRGRLSEGEIRRLAREELFRPLVQAVKDGKIKRWYPMQWSAVEHERAGCIGRVAFSQDLVTPTMYVTRAGTVGELVTPFLSTETNVAYEALTALIGAAATHPWLERSNEAFKATVYRHTAACQYCSGRTGRLSMYVEVDWAGRTLTLEYAL